MSLCSASNLVRLGAITSTLTACKPLGYRCITTGLKTPAGYRCIYGVSITYFNCLPARARNPPWSAGGLVSFKAIYSAGGPAGCRVQKEPRRACGRCNGYCITKRRGCNEAVIGVYAFRSSFARAQMKIQEHHNKYIINCISGVRLFATSLAYEGQSCGWILFHFCLMHRFF